MRALPPGHSLTITTAGERIAVREAALPDHVSPAPPCDRREAVAMLRQLLEDSLRHHLISDVPLGAFLSGGIDSSALVALMARVTREKPKTFSVVFSESDFSEAAHARTIAQMFSSEHKEIMLSEERLLGLLPDALNAMDRPTMDGINTYVISKAVKEAGVTVALSGLGGHELFAGYPSFRRAEQLRSWAFVPNPLRVAVSQVGRSVLNGSSRRRKFWDLLATDGSACAAYLISRQLFAPAEIQSLLFDSQAVQGLIPCATGADRINAVAEHELTGYMSNTLLRDTDQMSMAHGLEVRVPFIDPMVVRYVLALPGRWKVDRHRPKPLLLDTLGDLIPEEIWRRPKMGFTLPFQRWLGSALQPELDHAFLHASGWDRLGFDAGAIRSVWHTYRNNPGEEPWSRPWSLYVLKSWCERNDLSL
jgi:asparagine synthase (glutamine-hydrolysing)